MPNTKNMLKSKLRCAKHDKTNVKNKQTTTTATTKISGGQLALARGISPAKNGACLKILPLARVGNAFHKNGEQTVTQNINA